MRSSTTAASSLRSLSALGDVKSGLKTGDHSGTRGKRLSDRYLAGLLDSDGSVQVRWLRKGRGGRNDNQAVMRCHAVVRFDQKKCDGKGYIATVMDSIIPPSAGRGWGSIGQSESGTWYWVVTGKRAVSTLMRLRKYLVVHRHVADVAIEMNGQDFVRDYGTKLFAAARLVYPTLPKHPTKPWVAGYIDGDGSLEIRIPRGVSAQPVLAVSGAAINRAGVDLLRKTYGGSIREWVSKAGTPLVTWTLSMDAAKVRAMMESGKKQGCLAKHSVIKKDLFYFLVGCAKMGHFRDGRVIQKHARYLQTQPHRLSGPSVAVEQCLSEVRDIPRFVGPGAAERKRQWEVGNTLL